MKVLAAAACAVFLSSALAQNPLESLDVSGFSATQKQILTSVLQNQHCTCGCDWTIAKCREDDPKCSYSRQLLNLVMKDVKGGMDEQHVIADLKEHAMKPPPILEPPVSLNTKGDPSLGPDSARVTIVEFSDFQCGYCAAAVSQARGLLDKYPNDVRLVFKQFPLDFHSQSFLA